MQFERAQGVAFAIKHSKELDLTANLFINLKQSAVAGDLGKYSMVVPVVRKPDVFRNPLLFSFAVDNWPFILFVVVQ